MTRHKPPPISAPEQQAQIRSSQTFVLALIASLLVWAAFPPVGWSGLAWLSAAGWGYLIQHERLPGRRPYVAIWFASAVGWVLVLEGVRRAHVANYLGLALLGSYLAVYQVLFVALTRVAIRRWNLSLVWAAPIVWTGLELARGYVITGFSMALLGHTQAHLTPLIQVADLSGAYGVSFLIVLVGVCLTRALPYGERNWSVWPVILGGTVLALVTLYGMTRTNGATDQSRSLKIALIQGTEDTILNDDVAAAQRRAVETFNQYWRLTLDVCEQHHDLDLIVWPESVFSANLPELVAEGQILPPPDSGLSSAEFEDLFQRRIGEFHEKARLAAEAFNRSAPLSGEHASGVQHPGTYLLVGTDAVHWSGLHQRTYNSALLIDPTGDIVGRYDKMHRVMLGEYVPFGERFPWLYSVAPIGRGLTPGSQPKAFDIHGVSITPSICFESTVPHLIRRQVQALAQQGQPPEILVNLTNDGWFWGSSILDLHLACAIFRAVELRRPYVVAANTGLTAAIDGDGVVRELLPRRQEGFIVTQVTTDARRSHYAIWGDLFAGLCLAVCGALGITAWWTRRKRSRPATTEAPGKATSSPNSR